MSGKAGEKLRSTPASLIKAEVSIQVVRIGRKQMTLSVFRQLERDDDITGPIWGWVNYHPDNCAEDRAHLHAIWQDGDKLKRATTHHTPRFDTNTYINDYHPVLAILTLAAIQDNFSWHNLIKPNFRNSFRHYDYSRAANDSALVYIKKKKEGGVSLYISESRSTVTNGIIIGGDIIDIIGEYWWLKSELMTTLKDLTAHILIYREECYDVDFDLDSCIRHHLKFGKSNILEQMLGDKLNFFRNALHNIDRIHRYFNSAIRIKKKISVLKRTLDEINNAYTLEHAQNAAAQIIDEKANRLEALLKLWDEVKNSEQLFIAV